MKVVRSVEQMQKIAGSLKKQGRTIGFVPTMGALHRGHMSLVKRAGAANDIVVVSIFVNPAQFGPGEDYLKYPRPFAADKAACAQNGVDVLFVPDPEQMYPENYLTYISVEKMGDGLCGAFRPGHFRGVATIVAKLFNIVQPDAAYFGSKDYQQLKIIQRMVQDLNFRVKIVPCPIVREPSGLALSSRNQYLSPERKMQSAALNKALEYAGVHLKAGASAAKVREGMKRMILERVGDARFDYIEIVDAQTLNPVKKLVLPVVVALAVKIGTTRLIDNKVVSR